MMCLLIVSITQLSEAQTRYVIKFKNKGTNPFSLSNPIQFLSQRAIDRRTRYNIALDSSDLPVTPRYVDSVRLAGSVTILNVSKWLNSVTIQTTDAAALNKINGLTFVQSTAPIGARINTGELTNNKFKEKIGPLSSARIESDVYNYGSSFGQIHIHNGEFLHDIGLSGQNMIIGMLDAGYSQYTSLRAFDSARINGQILGVYDFVAHDNSVTEDATHGMECFSIIAANIPGQFVGSAPKASFYLFRTEEDGIENPIEEHNWVCGAERVDSAGGDIISSSVGYNTFDNPAYNHTYADMNGKTTMAAIGATIAARKGMLLLIAAGNDGQNTWHYIGTPADADSIITVGAVATNGVVAGFSSYGPSADGRVKPDVASVGVSTTIQMPGNTVGSGNGTSFATPNMAGLTTCLWQGFPEFNNQKIISALKKSSSSFSNPDDRIGYGIPDMKKTVMFLVKDFATANASVGNCKTTINWTSKDVVAMKYEIERKAPGETSFTKITERFGTGGTFSTHTYQYNDTLINMQAGTISYRIRQIIDTSTAGFTADYTDTVTVNLASSCVTTAVVAVTPNTDDFIISPNPVRSHFSLSINTTSAIPNLTIRIIDGIGHTVFVQKSSKQSGTTTIDVPAYRLSPGKYYVSLYNGEKLIKTKPFLRL